MDIHAIGWVRSSRVDPVDDDWDTVVSTIELDAAQFGPDAVMGLTDFSHIEVVYVFDRVAPSEIETGARRPRNNPAWPTVGIFAQRAKSRPNRLGVSSCRLVGIDGLTLRVEGLDAIDGTAVVDIKPYMSEFAPRGPVHQPTWSREVMAGYWRSDPPKTP